MENGGTCLKDYVEFKFSNRPSFRICGGQPPAQNLVGTGPVNITFATDAETQYNGFYLQYQGKQSTAVFYICVGLIKNQIRKGAKAEL